MSQINFIFLSVLEPALTVFIMSVSELCAAKVLTVLCGSSVSHVRLPSTRNCLV